MNYTKLDFNVDKYYAIAYKTRIYGTKLIEKVEQNWHTWTQLVADAPWLYRWRPRKPENPQATTPLGQDIPTSDLIVADIALSIYTSAVWGFGIEEWMKYPFGRKPQNSRGNTHAPDRLNLAMRSIIKQQGRSTLEPMPHSQVYDMNWFNGCGLLIPVEFGALDQWLESLWLETVDEVKAARCLCPNHRISSK